MTDAPDTPLTTRRERLLFRVVEEHIASGTPIGSKALAAEGEFGVSPSMIRYELAWLERAGLLGHPHTSAGRVPTDSGYRLYAERLVVERGPAQAFPLVLEASQEVDTALQSTAEALSQVTNLLSLASAPPVSATVIRHIELLLLQPQIVMAVVITASGNVSKRHFAFDQSVDIKLVESAKSYLNETVTGTAIGSHALRRRLVSPDLSLREREFLTAIGPVFSDVMEEHEAVFVGGASRLMSELRAQEVAELGSLASALEERATRLALLRDALSADRVLIRLGDDHGDPRIRPLAMVSAGYGVGARNLGVVSLIGPVRMDYAVAISSVRSAAAVLSDFVAEVYA
jgi:heat-inducible transcriptional repressor